MAQERSQKVLKKLPMTENGPEVRCKTKSGQEFVVSWCVDRMRFTLWRNVEGGYRHIGTAKTPFDLYAQVPWEQ